MGKGKQRKPRGRPLDLGTIMPDRRLDFIIMGKAFNLMSGLLEPTTRELWEFANKESNGLPFSIQDIEHYLTTFAIPSGKVESYQDSNGVVHWRRNHWIL